MTIAFFSMALLQTAAQAISNQPPPSQDGRPTVVHVSAAILDINQVDTASQSFTANVFFSARWFDSRLRHSGDAPIIRNLSEVWEPNIAIVNRMDVTASLPEVVEIRSDGQVTYAQRVWGSFSDAMDLRLFPFDNQSFEIILASARYSGDVVYLEPDKTIASEMGKQISLPDWTIQNWSLKTESSTSILGMTDHSTIRLRINASRNTGYYLFKIVMPLTLIVAMSWMVFWINPEEPNIQFPVAIQSILTLIAYRFVIGDLVPPVSYLTRLDYFVLGSTFIVFGSIVECLFTYTLARSGRALLARKVDVFCRVAVPIGFGVFMAVTVFGA